MTARDEAVEEVADAILNDITDRRGWRQEWDGFDDDIKQEIRSTLGRLAVETFEAAMLERGKKMLSREPTPEMLQKMLTGNIREHWQNGWDAADD